MCLVVGDTLKGEKELVASATEVGGKGALMPVRVMRQGLLTFAAAILVQLLVLANPALRLSNCCVITHSAALMKYSLNI